MLKFRHEWKYLVSSQQIATLELRMNAILSSDGISYNQPVF